MDAVTNFAYGSVLTAPSPATSGTTLVLQSGEGARFPDPSTDGEFNIVVWATGEQPNSTNAEIVKVTARTSDTLTIVRQQEDTTARTIVAGDEVALVPTKKFRDQIDDWFKFTQSSGVSSGCTITDDLAGGVDLSVGYGWIRATDSPVARAFPFSISGLGSVVLTDNSINYIFVEYNAFASNHAIYSVGTTDDSNGNSKIRIGKVYRSGTVLSIVEDGNRLNDFFGRVNTHHKESDDVQFVSGARVSEVGTRDIYITAGVAYSGLARIETAVFDGSGADVFYYYYYNGSAWVSSGGTAINNTQYNDTASGLVALTTNRYGVHWVYQGINGDTYVLYGQGDYLLQEAQQASPPTSLPDVVQEMAVLRAKIIIQKSATAFTEVENVTSVSFELNGVGVHNELSGLQGGTTDEYYHFTSADYTNRLLKSTTSLSGVSFFLDEDTMSSNSATKVPSQQSVKAYVDSASLGSTSFQIDQSGGTSDTFGVLSGAINGSNTVFTVSQGEYITGTLHVYLNGQLQTQGSGEDWVELTPSSGTFGFVSEPLTGDLITVSYQYVASTAGNADTLDGEHLTGVLAKVYPVGSIYINASDGTNPATLLGFGTWTAFGAGRVPVGLNSGDTDFDTAEETGGHKNLQAHTHGDGSYGADADGNHRHQPSGTGYFVATGGTANMNFQSGGYSRQHDAYTTYSGTHTHGVSGTSGSTGSGDSQNLQPYIVVYMWKRTA